jgi:hypothetical protein
MNVARGGGQWAEKGLQRSIRNVGDGDRPRYVQCVSGGR